MLCASLYEERGSGDPGRGRTRQRFTIAHELGHFLLNRSAGLRVDREVIGRVVTGRGDQATPAEELEANVFAATVLMPEELLRKEMEAVGAADLWFEERHIAEMAGRYGVSVQALVFRLSDLGFIER
jgi:Zn-dependent peptidase ImmA (M78 family)